MSAAIAGMLAVGVSAQASAQKYPDRPIRFILPFAAGGGTDVVARLFADQVAQDLGQQVVIDNRPSAGGVVGTEMGVRAEPDGYTLLMGLPVTITVAPAIFRKLPYDPLRDLAPVGLVGASAYVLAVHPSVPAKSVSELIALAKAKPGSLRYAAGTVGAGNHLSAELFKSMTGTNLLYVPYKGGGPALVGVFTGEAHLIFGSMLTTVPHVRSGKLRPLGVTSLTRATALPDVPTIAEAGVAGYDVPVWFAIFAPRKTPPAIVSLLNQQIQKMMSDPRAKATFAAQGLEARPSTPEELTRLIRAEIAKWTRVVKESGAKVD
jgi:tripartite-type tricarboxylate transporter receptor subunit TctC